VDPPAASALEVRSELALQGTRGRTSDIGWPMASGEWEGYNNCIGTRRSGFAQ
jgi:hypothetical protein